MNNTILILSISYALSLICVGFLVRYYRNEIQRWVEYSCTLQNGWTTTIEEMIERGNKILELVNSMNILKNQNLRYSKICRRLYEEKHHLSIEIEELKLKITELENKKLKPKPKK